MVITGLRPGNGPRRWNAARRKTTFEDGTGDFRRLPGAGPVRSVGRVIEVRNLSKRYGGTVAVDELSFAVRPGRVTGFLGPNGAGKSTTMRMMLDLDRPTAGRVLIGGRRYRDLPEPLRHVGALLDAGAVHAGRSARHHLLWLARSNRIPAARVREVLELTGLESVAGRRAGGFSLGMSQRLGIAAALLGDPPVLLFDEPVNGLDPEGVLWIRRLMRGMAAEGRTVFVSSHLMGETALAADHLIVIGRGRLLADTTVPEFIEANSRSYVRIRTPQPERMRDVLTEAGIPVRQAADGALEAHGAEAAKVGELAAAGGLTVHEVGTRTASLEEAFMRLTGESVEYRAGGADR
ncbi:ABC transporter ATP-binding protein [Planomonospora parontospora subsp. parontospora]|uniref:ABC transporter ATP-binding protein n=2 Tax=Planomonospora parontospora TaxID=58119 RepID=A0AA37BK69_9ACTN|nr:ABC transporter ATP-binding protein [Planomonospora parontospora]GII11785.1 ABC transporter ATP-binding protein [Planomonospora parontospora subsp. parontospora]